MLGPKDVRDEIIGQLSMDNIMKDTENISEKFPWRLTGTKAAAGCGGLCSGDDEKKWCGRKTDRSDRVFKYS